MKRITLLSGGSATWTTEPNFDQVRRGLRPGVYSSKRLNPPSGEDCACLLVREDGTLGWCYPDGSQSEGDRGEVSRFTARDLCSSD